MPSETRNLLFTTPEVVRAIVSHRRAKGEPLPRGSVLSFDVSNDGADGEVRFSFVVAPDDVDPPTAYVTIALEGPELAALLIEFCIKARIPMPRRADKSLRIQEGQVCLELTSKRKDLN